MFTKETPGRRGRRAGEGGGLSKCALPHKPSLAPAQAPRVYVLRLQGRGTADIRYLRLLLKMLGRAYGLRCLSIEPEGTP
jgi:hypothetical protein